MKITDILWIICVLGVMALWTAISPVPKADISEVDTTWIVHDTTTETLDTTPTTVEAPAETRPPVASSVCESISEEDQELLARVAYLEAPSQGWEGMAVIVNVILNRANLYGASIHDIVYSPGQFAVTDLISSCTPPQDAYTAVWAVMQGWDASAGALYFCSPAHNGWHKAHLTYLFSAWGHEFYK